MTKKEKEFIKYLEDTIEEIKDKAKKVYGNKFEDCDCKYLNITVDLVDYSYLNTHIADRFDRFKFEGDDKWSEVR